MTVKLSPLVRFTCECRIVRGKFPDIFVHLLKSLLEAIMSLQNRPKVQDVHLASIFIPFYEDPVLKVLGG